MKKPIPATRRKTIPAFCVRTLCVLLFFVALLPGKLFAQVANQTVLNGASTAVTFPSTDCVYHWINNTPGIGLAASGAGNIPAFTTVNTGSSPVTATITATPANGGLAYIANAGSNNISVINTATNMVISTLPVDKTPYNVAISHDGTKLYVLNEQTNTVSVVNSTTGALLSSIQLGPFSGAMAISPDGSKLYVTSGLDGGGLLSVISTLTNNITATIRIGDNLARHFVISADGSTIYLEYLTTFSSPQPYASYAISAINTANNTVISTIPVSSEPGDLAISPDGKQLYASFNNTSEPLVPPNISVFNTENSAITFISTVPVAGQLGALTVSQDGSRLYVANTSKNTISVIKPATNAILSTIPVGSNPIGISLTPDQSFLYVTNLNSSSVSVINTQTNLVVATIPVGVAPISSGNFIISDNGCTGTPVTFTITVNPTPPGIHAGTVAGHISANEGTASVNPNVQHFVVSAGSLTDDVTATAPAGFEVSLAADTGYSNSVTIVKSNVAITGTVLYVRSAANNHPGTITGNITLSSAGNTDLAVAVTGVIHALPDGIHPGAVTGIISSCNGVASTNPYLQQFTVIGTGLTDNIIATAPTGFEVSLTSTSGYSSSVTLAQSGGLVAITPVYVRSAASAHPGFISGNVVLSSTGLTSSNIMVTGNISTPPVVNALANQVVYGGSATAAVNPPGTASAYIWINNTPGIGLAAAGTGQIPSFTAINNGTSPVTATITTTPLSAGFAYTTDQKTGKIYIINTTSNTLADTISGRATTAGIALSPDGSKIYIASQNPNVLTVINTAGYKATATISLDYAPSAVAVSPDNTRVYVSSTAGKLYVIDEASNTIVNTAPLAAGYMAISPDGKRLYTTGNGTVVVFDLTTYATLTTIVTGTTYSPLVLSRDGSRLYLINSSPTAPSRFSIINTTNNTVVTSADLDSGDNITLSADGNTAYITDEASSNISVINIANNLSISSIPIGHFGTVSALNPSSGLLYVPRRDSISVINPLTGSLISNIPVGTAATYLNRISIGGPGCSGLPVTYTITVKPQPQNITAGPVTGIITACAGSASASPNTGQMIVSGVKLTGNITVTASAAFEVSLVPGSGYGNSVIIPHTAGVVDSVTVYIRSAAIDAAGSISGNLVLSSIGITSQSVPVNAVIKPIPTVNPISNQTVNPGTATSAINFTGTANTFNWVNNTPGIGLAASGSGNIPAFTAINNSVAPVTGSITATPTNAVYTYICSLSFGSNLISTINTLTGMPVNTITVGTDPLPGASSPDGSSIYIPNQTAKTVSVINTETSQVTATINLGTYYPLSLKISPDGGRIYVACGTASNTGAILIISTATNSISSTIPLSATSTAMTMTPDGSKLYVAEYLSSSLSVINTATGLVTAQSKLPINISSLNISPDGSRLYVLSGDIYVYDTTSNEIMYIIPSGDEEFALNMVISPDGSQLYILNSDVYFNIAHHTNYVSIINIKTRSVINTIQLPAYANLISMSPDGSLINVSCQNSKDISVISTATNAIINTIHSNYLSVATIGFSGMGGCPGAPTTFTITVNPTPGLSNLAISNSTLSPAFTPHSNNYTATVNYTTTSVNITPTVAVPGSTVKVNGTAVTPGTPLPVTLNTAPDTTPIAVVVTAADGASQQTYHIAVTPIDSASAKLNGLTLSTGSKLNLTTGPGYVNYSASVDPSVSSLTVSPITAAPGATITVNGAPVASGSASGDIAVNAAPATTLITIVVTAADGVATKTYLITVNPIGDGNAKLSALSFSTHSKLRLVAGPGYVNYDISVDPSVSSLTLTAVAADAAKGATITLNGAPLTSGAISDAITLNAAPATTLITIVVTAADGISKNTYLVTVFPIGSGDATLSALSLSTHSKLNLTTGPGYANYSASVDPSVSSINITAVAAAAAEGASIFINGIPAPSGETLYNLPVNNTPATTLITIVVIAPDQISQNTYLLTIHPVGSGDATLSSLSLSTHSTLTQTTGPGYVNYTAAVDPSLAALTVTPVANNAGSATITVNGAPVPSGNPSGTIALNADPATTLITTVVTAADGTSQNTYLITVSHSGEGAALKITGLLPLAAQNSDAIVVHQGLSPNGDGIDDFLRIDGIDAYPDNKLAIMDRNGILVYEARGYNNSNVVFSGRSNKTGVLQLPGTYFYQLNYTSGGIAKRRTGFIVLKY